MEPTFPLHARVCGNCYLVQLDAFETPEQIFGNYAYFSSYSDSWLRHARNFAESAMGRFGLGSQSLVIEVASNDGYLLRWFRDMGIPTLGIEPAANVARAAEKLGIPTRVEFFGKASATNLANEGRMADLVVANNVLAHVPDINDFVAGFSMVLKPEGIAVLEFPHLQRLMERRQFDTIYHEHFSYLSLGTVKEIFTKHGMRTFDVEEIPTHGGSLRVYSSHSTSGPKESPAVGRLLEGEIKFGLRSLSRYGSFQEEVKKIKWDLLSFLIDAKRNGKRIAGYGAPAKGNTLLNYCGVRSDFVDFTVDRNPNKQNTWLPGTRIPVHAADYIRVMKPDFLLVLPWNIKEEIMGQMYFIRDWGGQFIIPIPDVRVI